MILIASLPINMKINQLFKHIEDLYKWLNDVRGYNLNFKCKNENDPWHELESLLPINIEELPGFYIIKIKNKYRNNQCYNNNKKYFEKTDIVYIGESTNLKNRISALRTSIGKDRGKGSHSGGITLGKELKGKKSDFEIIWICTSDIERKNDEHKKDQGPFLAKLFERYLVFSFLKINQEKPKANKE